MSSFLSHLVAVVVRDLALAWRRKADVLGTLSSAGVDASITPYREEHVRVGPSIVTAPEECDTLLEALAQ